MPLLHSRSFGSLSGLLDNPPSATSSRRSRTPDKPLPLTPQPSGSMPLSPFDPEEDEETLVPSSARSSLTAVTSKRTHALLELLSSERAYASDLALIRDIHYPLALGQPSPYPTAPATPPGSSSSSSRTLSTVSNSSAGSSSSAGGPPMTPEDARIIFNNVDDLAFFSDSFTEALEEALGDVLEGGSGQDRVGKLFLDTIPRLEPLYRTYITKHPTAIEHLNNLPQTPALAAYLAQTRSLASSLSHAWDLPSLLIKPVQRLLKYPLLLATVIEETPDSHGDKANLRLAREKMEEVARGREVVREVLMASGAGTPTKSGEMKAKKKGLNVGVAASVSLGRMKSLRSAAYKAKEGAEASQESEEVKRLGARLKQFADFLQRFARDATVWAESVRELTVSLDGWAKSFGRVIWMGSDVRSEAFDAFLNLISDELLPVCDNSKELLEEKVLPNFTQFLHIIDPPLRLLEAMQTLEPLHFGLLNLNISKSRPPPQLLEASQSYVALRAQLFAELPDYLRLLERGIGLCVTRFAQVQYSFYSGMRARWADLWDALKVDEEANAGAMETMRVWWERYRDVEIAVMGLNISRPLDKKSHDKSRRKSGGKQSSLHEGEVTQSMVVSSVLSALDPLNIAVSTPSTSAFATSPIPYSAKARSVNSMDIENQQQMVGRRSSESLHSKKSGKSRASSTRGHSMGGATLVDEAGYIYPVPPLAALAPARTPEKPTYSRTKSMPLSPTAALKKSQSQTRLLEVPESISPSSSNPSLHSVAGSLQEDSRGRPSRKPSFRRRLTDSFRSNNVSTDSRHRRSPSLPSNVCYGAAPSPSPTKSSFTPPMAPTARKRASGGPVPPLYQCRVIHPCEPPPGVSYRERPFFTLRLGDVYDILKEVGHPSTHHDLPLYVDDGEDCLLLARDELGGIGWVLASFLLPVD
ncbi:hypothetical protein C8Q78DRAFT_1070654 [Trametes maxima]|nr:hypothetical protein C8Q78DRAFT_1070654 [Trametes maxima]